MREKREINKSHSLYPEYIKRCKKLFSKYDLLIEEEKARHPRQNELDYQAIESIIALERQRNAELREIQQEYEILFTCDAVEG